MGHHCGACLVTCEDFRLHRRSDGRNFIGEFIGTLSTDCDLIARAGSIHDLVHTDTGRGAVLLRSLDVAVNLHGVESIYLVNHQDCGAYGHFAFTSLDEELERHRRDLLAARDMLRARYPSVHVVPLFARLDGPSDDQWVMTNVEAPN